MPKFLVEVKHEDDHDACVRALKAIQQSGSHLMTHAEWGCKDQVHSCWLFAEVENREQAMQMVPPEFRHGTRIIQLNRFSQDEIASLVFELEERTQNS